MEPSSRPDSWRRWSVAGVGALLCGVVVGTVTLSHPSWTTAHYLQFGIPVLLALGLAAYGGWLVTSDLSPERIHRIALWSLGGAAVLGSFAGWEMYTHLLEGEPFVGTLHEPLFGVAEGATVGGVVGYYDARRRDQYLELETVFKFLHIYTTRITATGGLGVFTVDNASHDSRTVNTLTNEFDCVIELREAEGGEREVRIRGMPDVERVWRPF